MPLAETSARTVVHGYDFAVDGGTVGTKQLRGRTIPGTAIIVDAFVSVEVALAGGTGTDTLELRLESANDIQTATARNGAPWSTTGIKRVTFTTTTTPLQLTADRQVQFLIAATALTGGRFRTYIRYIDPSS
jgi:hypothetical protein